MPSTALEAQVLSLINERTAPEPDGVQDASGELFTGTKRLKQEASKDNIDCSKAELEDAVDALVEEGSLITWHGLLAPANADHLQAIIENEKQSEITRDLLIRKCEGFLEATEVAA
ncbi:hypothetical protein [Natrarchaeobius oligotrophus]|uniref:Uncharacterized protein n=1 Tax=Natrarchaeobius chitinivorans TaxID=1679083 RepID=A0A3N6P652_NATCH|nr:hypothetical protein [Natrarchaeobius chitinivorans]RQG93759.1 hypothetical protein EA472_22795 [Natrarchaeobius chitinivorans]